MQLGSRVVILRGTDYRVLSIEGLLVGYAIVGEPITPALAVGVQGCCLYRDWLLIIEWPPCRLYQHGGTHYPSTWVRGPVVLSLEGLVIEF